MLQTKTLAVNLRLNRTHTILQTKHLAVFILRLNQGPTNQKFSRKF